MLSKRDMLFVTDLVRNERQESIRVNVLKNIDTINLFFGGIHGLSGCKERWRLVRTILVLTVL